METSFLFTGKNITSSNTETLVKKNVYDVFKIIKEDTELKNETQRLRKVKLVDKQSYENLKKRLPFFCCGVFKNNLRKSENFIEAGYFVLDIDNINDRELHNEISKKISEDTRMKMMFTSPGGNGIKVLFELSEVLKSLKKFSDFYKAFAYSFAQVYKIEKYVDFTTSDATRVCFLAYDEDARINKANETVCPSLFLPEDILNSIDAEKPTEKNDEKENDKQIPDETYKDILRKLNPPANAYKKQKQIFVPEILNQLMQPIEQQAILLGINVKEVRDIHYGKKIIFNFGKVFAEVNLFHGSKGFSVVKTPKNGSDMKLAEIGELLIRQVLAKVCFTVSNTLVLKKCFNQSRHYIN